MKLSKAFSLLAVVLAPWLLSFAPHQTIGSPFLPSCGKVNLLVLLVSFPDQPGKASLEEAEQMIFSRGRRTGGSVADYFFEVSGGRVEITGKVLGWFSAAQPEAYYANYAFGHQAEAYPRNSGRLVEEAVEAARKLGEDFATFDNSQSGSVDGLVVVFAGPGGNLGGRKDRLWPWLSYLSMNGSRPVLAGGKKIDRYILVGEQNARGEPNFVMPFCHELGHLFGLPDLYDWSSGSFGVGKFDLMGAGLYGGGKPFWPSAWTRAYLGWSELHELDTDGRYQLAPAEKNGPVFKIPTFVPQEYFLLENRAPMGMDAGLFGKGLVIYHVDEKVLTANDRACIGYCPEHHYLVAVEQADGSNQLERKQNSGDEGDFFPGTSRVRSFNDSTGMGEKYMEGASARLWNGELSGIRLNRIKLRQDQASFSLKLNQPKSPDLVTRELRLYEFRIIDLGNGDSVLEPGEEFKLLPVVSNQGVKVGKVKLALSAPGLWPEAAEIRLSGPLKPGQRIEAEPGFRLKVPESWPEAKQLTLHLAIETWLGNFRKDEKIELVIGRPEIVLVVDDSGLGLKNYYRESLWRAGKICHTLELKDSLPEPTLLEKFRLVIWLTGVRGAGQGQALDEKRQELLAALLDEGKNLLLVSPGISLPENSELGDRLGIISARFNDGVSAVRSESGSGAAAGLAQFYFPALNPSAVIQPAAGSAVLLRSLQNDPVAVFAKADRRGALTIAFPMEALPENTRAAWLKEFLSRLGF